MLLNKSFIYDVASDELNGKRFKYMGYPICRGGKFAKKHNLMELTNIRVSILSP